jgi:hypothetical protein
MMAKIQAAEPPPRTDRRRFQLDGQKCRCRLGASYLG